MKLVDLVGAENGCLARFGLCGKVWVKSQRPVSSSRHTDSPQHIRKHSISLSSVFMGES